MLTGAARTDKEVTLSELDEKIVFMTGGAVTKEAREFVARHSKRCIEKPFNREKLAAAVAKVDWIRSAAAERLASGFCLHAPHDGDPPPITGARTPGHMCRSVCVLAA